MASYCSASDVAALAPMLARGGSNFDSSTSPTQTQVEAFIQWITSDMHTSFYARGYSGSAASDAAMYDALVLTNALGAAALAELTRIVQTVRAEDRQRGLVLWRMYRNQRETLASSDLSQAGFGVDNVPPYAGGVDKDDKEIDAEDTTLVTPRFFRDQFMHPGLLVTEETL